jgi:DNA (cytosine-5)-methyltransferase 1
VKFDDWELLQVEAEKSVPCYRCGAQNTSVSWENKSGGSLDIILQEFANLGYKCVHTILNAADFGAPQLRERLFIVGSRDGELFEWPSPTHGKSHGPSQASLFDLNDLQPWRGVRETLWPNGHWKYGALKKEAVLWVKNVVRPHDEPVTWHLDRPSPTIGAHQGAKLTLAPIGVPEAQLFRQQWHSLGRRQGDTPPVFVEHEYLTDLELLKLQTFPENWYLFGTRMERAFQIGNAVPPVLARVVGAAILAAMGRERELSELQTKAV